MDRIALSDLEMSKMFCGEAITLAAVLAILTISIVAIVVFKLYQSSDGSVTLPGGYKFTRK